MSWQTEMTTIVRCLIGDVDASTYTDSRVEKLILVAGQLTLHDITFNNSYTIDVVASSISPDPTSGTKDNAFINLVSLKAACIESMSSYKTSVATGKTGVRIKDGNSEVDLKGSTDALKFAVENACEAYEQAKWEFEAGNLVPGKAILGPFSGDVFSASYIRSDNFS